MDDLTICESGMLSSNVQAAISTNLNEVKRTLKSRPFLPLGRCSSEGNTWSIFPPHPADSVRVPLLQPFDDHDHDHKHAVCVRHNESNHKFFLAIITCVRQDPGEFLLKHVLTLLSNIMSKLKQDIEDDPYLWVSLIEALALCNKDYAEGIICSLASLHSLPEVRTAAVQALGCEPPWALNHMQSLRKIACEDPDESVQEAAAASFQKLQGLEEQQQPENLEHARPVLHEDRPPPPIAERSPQGEVVRAAQQDQDSREEDLQSEQAQLHEALLRSKADAWSLDNVILTRLTFHRPEVTAHLLQAKEVESCRARVECAGCSVQPNLAKGAMLLVPVTEQQIVEADIELKPHNILMLQCDLQFVVEALARLARRKRPGLKPEHYPYGKSEVVANDSMDCHSQTNQWQGPQDCPSPVAEAPLLPDTDMQLHSEIQNIGSWIHESGIVVERTFLSFPVKKDVSEASTVVQSAPALGSTYAERVNPHQWRLPRPSGDTR